MGQNVNITSIQLINKNSLIRGCMENILSSEFPQETVEGFVDLSDWFRARGDSNPTRDVLILDQATFDQLQTVYHGPRLGMPRIILISDSHTVDDRARAARLGVKGWICSRDSVEVAVTATRVVMMGGIFVRPGAEAKTGSETALHVDHAFEASVRLGGLTGATPRQLAIIEAIGLGLSNAEVAARLRLREKTVRVHLRAIMAKLGVKSAASLARLCTDLVKYSSEMQARRRFRVEVEQVFTTDGLGVVPLTGEHVTYH
jgi:DNA-binding NarL/FixJ family response regulator